MAGSVFLRLKFKVTCRRYTRKISEFLRRETFGKSHRIPFQIMKFYVRDFHVSHFRRQACNWDGKMN